MSTGSTGPNNTNQGRSFNFSITGSVGCTGKLFDSTITAPSGCSGPESKVSTRSVINETLLDLNQLLDIYESTLDYNNLQENIQNAYRNLLIRTDDTRIIKMISRLDKCLSENLTIHHKRSRIDDGN